METEALSIENIQRAVGCEYATARGLHLYLTQHMPVGDFLTALLSNDLREACARADYINIHLLPAFMRFLFNYAPSGSYGSPERLRNWLRQGRHERENAAAGDTSAARLTTTHAADGTIPGGEGALRGLDSVALEPCAGPVGQPTEGD